MNRQCIIIIWIIALIPVSGVNAFTMFDDMNVSGSWESVFWNHDPADWDENTGALYEGPYQSFENILSLNLDWKNWLVEIRLRSMDYENPMHYDSRSREHETDFELFKVSAGYRGDQLRILAGDFYKYLGRGIVLYVQEDTELNLDRTIRGGSLDFNSNQFDFSAFGGEIHWYRFRDRISTMTTEEFQIKDKVFGARSVFHIPGNVDLGMSITNADIYDIIANKQESEGLWTGGVDLSVAGLGDGKFDFYSEYAELRWNDENPFGEDTEDGKALYCSLTGYLSDFTILAEYKDYDYWNYLYSRPPTADRDDEVAETEDIKGGRLRLDYVLPVSNTLFYISIGKFDNHAHPNSCGEVIRNEIEHYFGGVEQTWDRFYMNLTYGYKSYKTLDEVHRRITSDLVYTLDSRSSLNLYYEYKYTGTSQTDKEEHKSYLTYSFSPYYSVTFHYNQHEIEVNEASSKTDNWVAGELTLTPISALSISLLYGELPPGLLCSGGQCRIVPAFEGLQASVVYRF